MILKILLSGDGGQGIQLMSDLICRSAIEQGFFVSHIPNYGLEQRGGVSLAFIQISDSEIAYPRFSKPDLLLVMSPQAEERTRQYKNVECLRPELRPRVRMWNVGDYKQKLDEEKVPTQSYNIFFLGLLARMLEEKGVLKRDTVFEMLEKKLGAKSGWNDNKKAFDLTL